jgi:hypothetical protein
MLTLSVMKMFAASELYLRSKRLLAYQKFNGQLFEEIILTRMNEVAGKNVPSVWHEKYLKLCTPLGWNRTSIIQTQ